MAPLLIRAPLTRHCSISWGALRRLPTEERSLVADGKTRIASHPSSKYKARRQGLGRVAPCAYVNAGIAPPCDLGCELGLWLTTGWAVSDAGGRLSAEIGCWILMFLVAAATARIAAKMMRNQNPRSRRYRGLEPGTIAALMVAALLWAIRHPHQSPSGLDGTIGCAC